MMIDEQATPTFTAYIGLRKYIAPQNAGRKGDVWHDWRAGIECVKLFTRFRCYPWSKCTDERGFGWSAVNWIAEDFKFEKEGGLVITLFTGHVPNFGRFFGAARDDEEGLSLSVVALTLIDRLRG
jgi:hypothetical protein